MNDLTGKVAVITGGTSGIGEACACRLSQAGAKVVIAGRNETKGKRIENSIRGKGMEAAFVCVDVTQDESIENLAEFVKSNYGRADILFNNAGIFPVFPSLEEFSRDMCNLVFDVNITGMIMLTKAFLTMLSDARGTVLNNASVAGIHGFASGQGYAYAASKSAVIKYTEMLAKRYGSVFRTNCICPGFICTPLYMNFNEAAFAERVPLGRVGQPEDVAKVVNFMVSDDAAYMNGSVVTIDGGLAL